MWIVWLGCVALTCGPGTTAVDGVCLPVVDTDAGVPIDDTDDTDDGDTDDVAPLQVYLLAGQSNMDGYAYVSGLPPALQLPDARVPLYWSGWGAFRPVQPSSYGGPFFVGPEVPFGHALADAGVDVVLVKHAVGGTDLAGFWYPGATPDAPDAGPGFAVLADTLAAAAVELDAGGRPWQWAGFVWMQGESDALDVAMASAYEANLTRLVASVRVLTDAPALPVAVGLISRESFWTYADTVRTAQQDVADADPHVVTVETDDLPRNTLDLAHYDGPSNRVLGQRFARALRTGADVGPGDDAPSAAFRLEAARTDYDINATVGWSFTIASPIWITDVGGFGTGYLATTSELGIWDGDANLVVRTAVPAWLTAPTSWRGSFWYTAIPPVRLEAGTYRIGLVAWAGDGDRCANSATGTFAGPVAYGGGVYADGYWLTYPGIDTGKADQSWFGPNFLFVPAAP